MLQIPSMAKNRRDHVFDIKVTRQAAAETGEVSPLITHRLAKLDITLEKGIAMLSKEVQDLVDKSRKQTDVIKAVDAGMGALRKQNEEMKAKLDAIASGPLAEAGSAGQPSQTVYALSEDDLAGLREVSKNMDDAIESLKDDIPANVEPPAKPDPMETPAKQPESAQAQPQSADPGPQGEQQPQVADPGTHASDAQAASQAKPLDGTGAPAPEDKQDPAA